MFFKFFKKIIPISYCMLIFFMPVPRFIVDISLL